jgi:HPt (histidine-containing phosphotransfer) domain-containing protein
MGYGQLSFYGFAACLHKPFTRREMLEVISGLLPGNGFDFGQLTAFAAGDADAMAQIMDTFISETGKKREALEKAMEEKDIAAVTMITHQLLPIFALVGASEGKDELEWFEARRDADEYPAGADEKIALILEATGRIIAGAGVYK